MSSEKGSVFYNLTKKDTNIIKGIAILLIVVHNYVHLRTDRGENEVDFDMSRIFNVFFKILEDPLNVFETFFTFFGHYGVQLFILISAYGLTKKHMVVKIDSYMGYLFKRVIKVYALLTAGLIFNYMYVSYRARGIFPLSEYLDTVIHFYSMTFSFKMETLFSYVGPWWFFGLILQFYIIFPILFYLVKRYKMKGVVAITIISYILTYILYYMFKYDMTEFPVFGNVIGHIPELMLGMALAMFPQLKIDAKVALLVLSIFISSWFVEFIFPLSFFAVSILLLYSIRGLLTASKEAFGVKLLVFIGQISMFMFLINGPLRNTTLGYSSLFVKGTAGLWFGCLIHCLIVIGLSYMMSVLYAWIAKPIKKYTGIAI